MSTFEFETEMESEYEGEEEFEFEEEGEYETGEYETGEQEQFLGDILGSVLGGETESPLSEAQETELAGELLEIQSEEELEQFLGNIFKGVAKSVGGFIKSPVGQALGGVLKNVAKKALPVVGGALGSFVAPGLGTAVGSKLGSMASNLFELELEGMEAEEAEFEVARRVVRLAASAAQHAATAPQRAPARQVARTAIVQAARQHAPGLVRGTQHGARPRHRARQSGGYGATRGRRPTPPQARRQRRPGQPGRSGGGRPGRPGRPSVAFARSPSSAGWLPGAYDDSGYQPEPSYDDEPFGYADGNGSGGSGASQYGGRQRSGRWIRRGRKIVLIGV